MHGIVEYFGLPWILLLGPGIEGAALPTLGLIGLIIAFFFPFYKTAELFHKNNSTISYMFAWFIPWLTWFAFINTGFIRKGFGNHTLEPFAIINICLMSTIVLNLSKKWSLKPRLYIILVGASFAVITFSANTRYIGK